MTVYCVYKLRYEINSEYLCRIFDNLESAEKFVDSNKSEEYSLSIIKWSVSK